MFSVVLPLYNKRDTLAKALDSVLLQDFEGELEIIVVDDGSSDQPEQVLAPYLTDARVHLIKQTNKGVSLARNAGILQCRFPYVCFIDADDEWLQGHLNCLADLIRRYPEAGAYFTAVRILSPNGKSATTSSMLPFSAADSLIDDLYGALNQMGGPGALYLISACIKRDTLIRWGMFEPGVRIGEDYDLWLRLAVDTPFVLTKQVTAVYHRELSTATKASSFDVDWFFQRREQELLTDKSMPESKKINFKICMDRFRLYQARHLILAGQKQKADAALGRIENRRYFSKEIFVTRFCLALPAAWVRRLYDWKKARE